MEVRSKLYFTLVENRYSSNLVIFDKKNSELRSGAGDVSVSSGQNERMNSVRVGDEYWLKASV